MKGKTHPKCPWYHSTEEAVGQDCAWTLAETSSLLLPDSAMWPASLRSCCHDFPTMIGLRVKIISSFLKLLVKIFCLSNVVFLNNEISYNFEVLLIIKCVTHNTSVIIINNSKRFSTKWIVFQPHFGIHFWLLLVQYFLS